jgi:hypothetical protein
MSTRQEEANTMKTARHLNSSSPSIFHSINETSECASNQAKALTSLIDEPELDSSIVSALPDSTTTASANDRLVMPSWFQDLREQSHLRARRKKEPTYNWASAQINQMHYEIRQSLGKRMHVHVEFDCHSDE